LEYTYDFTSGKHEYPGKDGLKMLKNISRRWEKYVGGKRAKKGRNGRKSLRRLKPIVGCNASKRRRRRLSVR